MKRLTDHWELKAISLVLAIAIYLFTGSITTSSRRVPVSIDSVELRTGIERSLPRGFAVRDIKPDQVEVTINGPIGLLDDLDPATVSPRLEVSAASLSVGAETFDLTADLLGLDPALVLSDATAETIQVEIDEMIAVTRPLAELPYTNLPSGLKVLGITYTFDQVRITGPRRLLDELDQVPIHQVDLSTSSNQLIDEATVTVPLVPKVSDDLVIEQLGQLSATIRVSPVLDVQPVGPLPIGILAGDAFHRDYVAQLSTDVVVLTVHGPRNRLETLRPDEQIQVFVELPDNPTTGTAEPRPLRVVAPSWAGVDPAQVRVTVVERSSLEAVTLPDATTDPDSELPEGGELPPDGEPLPPETGDLPANDELLPDSDPPPPGSDMDLP